MNRFDYNQPNTRERLAARRKMSRPKRPRQDSLVIPGPRRAVGAWLASGRIVSLMLFIASIGALFHIFTAPTFAVRDVRVEGAQVLKPAQLVELANARGQSIWFVDTDQIAERLKSSAYVEQAAAYVSLPDQLTLIVQERRPEVRWQSGGTRYLVDGSGRVLDVDGTAPLSDTLVIVDRSNVPLEPNDHVDADALGLGRALSLRLPSEAQVQPAEISWNIDTGVYVSTPDGRTIVFGPSERLDEKLLILNALMREGTQFTYLDLRPSTPFYRNDQPQPTQ